MGVQLMKAPDFWYRPNGFRSVVLSPLGAIYAFATRRRLKNARPKDVGVPVICVGNINVGGTGKTPTAIALIERLTARGHNPAIISRGYGGDVEGPHRVDERNDSASSVGDEPLLLAAFAPTWVSKDRAAGAQKAVADGADVIIMDDGFQSGALKIDLGIIVVDAGRGFGNGKCLPAGPLREPVDAGLARGDVLLSIGHEQAQTDFDRVVGPVPDITRVRAHLEPLQTGMDWEGLRVLAFAGIGHPEKFFLTLKEMGAEIVETHALADHQPLDSKLISRLSQRASALGARLVATEKDAVRLPQSYRTEVLTVPVRLRLSDWSLLDAALDRIGL